nr:MAG TPA: hypothetical protein [Bacteriophage sp.]
MLNLVTVLCKYETVLLAEYFNFPFTTAPINLHPFL